MARKVLHVDLDAFFCSVELLRHPEYHGHPFVVGGQPGSRGVVSSASYPARDYGIRSAMPIAQALGRCPDLIILPPDHKTYSKVSLEVMQLLRESAPIIEPISIDEAFLDVSDARESGEEIARSLGILIEERFRLPTSWGVATNKLVAKIATEVGKPNGLVVVPPGDEADFLAPLPVDMLWGIGPKSKEVLLKHGIETIGAIATLSERQLQELFGERGPELAAKAKGLDNRPIEESQVRRSISSERTYSQDVSDETLLHRTLLMMSEELGSRMRHDGLAGTTVKIKVRWPDFTTISRQTRLDQPTDQDDEIYQASLQLFQSVWKQGKKVRLLGVGVSDLGGPIRQLHLFDRSWEEDVRLLEAIDAIRDRFGRDALRRASTLRSKRNQAVYDRKSQ
jgi:DNA polymerase-4